MGDWGISENSSEKEKIKSEFADYINGLNCCGNIDYHTYSSLFDFTMPLLDKMFEHGRTMPTKTNDPPIEDLNT